MHADGLACFRGVAATGCEHVQAVTCGGKQRCEDSRFHWANAKLARGKQSVAGTCHALDGKRLPRCLAELRCRCNRR